MFARVRDRKMDLVRAEIFQQNSRFAADLKTRNAVRVI